MIEYTGLRPGEKLYEELMTEGEGVIPTTHHKIMVLSGRKCNIDEVNDGINVLRKLAKERDKQKIISQFKKMVPEFNPILDN